MKTRLSSLGFTLAELLIVVAIFGLLMIIATQVFINAMKAGISAEGLKTVRQEGSYAMSLLVKRVQEAKSIDPSCSSPTANAFTSHYEDGTDFILTRIESSVGHWRIQESENGTPHFLTSPNVSLALDATNNPLFIIDCSSLASLGTVGISFTLEFVPFGKVSSLLSNKKEESVRMPFVTSVTVRR